MKKILITGGAGFIGGHLAEELLRHEYDVRILDVLDPQVHENGAIPDYLNDEVEFVGADIRDAPAVERAVRGVDGVVHLAAAVGVGQSMYQLHKYVDVNASGTAVLLEAINKHPVERLVVASSMSVYGEGAYVRDAGDRVAAGEQQAPVAGGLDRLATTDATRRGHRANVSCGRRQKRQRWPLESR